MSLDEKQFTRTFFMQKQKVSNVNQHFTKELNFITARLTWVLELKTEGRLQIYREIEIKVKQMHKVEAKPALELIAFVCWWAEAGEMNFLLDIHNSFEYHL